MIQPENEEWHGVWFPEFFIYLFFYFTFIFSYFYHLNDEVGTHKDISSHVDNTTAENRKRNQAVSPSDNKLTYLCLCLALG